MSKNQPISNGNPPLQENQLEGAELLQDLVDGCSPLKGRDGRGEGVVASGVIEPGKTLKSNKAFLRRIRAWNAPSPGCN